MTTTRATHMIVLPGGGYAAHAPHEAELVARWLDETGVQASVFRYPLNVRHPAPLDALRAEIGRRRGRQPAAAPVDIARFAGHPRVTAVLRLAHRRGSLRPSRAHLPLRLGAGGQRCPPRRARVRPRPAWPWPGPGRWRDRDLDQAGECLDPGAGGGRPYHRHPVSGGRVAVVPGVPGPVSFLGGHADDGLATKTAVAELVEYLAGAVQFHRGPDPRSDRAVGEHARNLGQSLR